MRLFKLCHDNDQNGTKSSCARILRNLTWYLLDFVLLPQQLMRYVRYGIGVHCPCQLFVSCPGISCAQASRSSFVCRLSPHQLCPRQSFVSFLSVVPTSVVPESVVRQLSSRQLFVNQSYVGCPTARQDGTQGWRRGTGGAMGDLRLYVLL